MVAVTDSSGRFSTLTSFTSSGSPSTTILTLFFAGTAVASATSVRLDPFSCSLFSRSYLTSLAPCDGCNNDLKEKCGLVRLSFFADFGEETGESGSPLLVSESIPGGANMSLLEREREPSARQSRDA